MDILVERSEENLATLLRALSSFGEGHARELALADFDESEGAVRVIEEFPLDIFTVMRGQTYADLIGSVERTQIDKLDICYLNAKGLIALKEQSPREKDRIDVSALRAAAH